MARRSELVAGMAEALKINEQTVNVCARHMREAGMIAEKGRGLSAAQMGPRDAVNLLLGLVAAPELKDAAECVKRVRGLKFWGDIEGREKVAVDEFVDLKGLPEISWFWRGGEKPAQLGEVLDAMLDHHFMIPYQDTALPVTYFFLTIYRRASWLNGQEAMIEFGDGTCRWKIHYTELNPYRKKWTQEKARKLVPPQPWGMETTTRISIDEMIAIMHILEPDQKTAKDE